MFIREKKEITRQNVQKRVDFWVHDWLSNQRESAVFDLVGFFEAGWDDAGDPPELLDAVVMLLHCAIPQA